MLTARYILMSLLMAGMAFSAFGCAVTRDGGTVTLMEDGKTRTVDAGTFDEQSYLRRGYIKNTDGRGGALYVHVPSTDEKPDYQFMDKYGDSPPMNIPHGGIGRPIVQ